MDIRDGPMLLVALLTLAGCGESRDAASAEEEEQGRGFELWEAEEPDVRLGSIGGEVTFTRVGDVMVGPGGRVHVLDLQDAIVYRFGMDGRPAGTVGRKGEGPGEFSRPTVIGFLGDTVWVLDGGHERVSLFSPDGALIRDRPLPRAPESLEGESSRPGGLAPEGRVLVRIEPGQLQDPGSRRFPLLALDRGGGGAADTLATLDREHVGMIFITLSGGKLVGPLEVEPPLNPGQIARIEVLRQVPFPDFTMLDVTPSGDQLALADRAVEEGEAAAGTPGFTLTRIDSSGDTIFSVRRSYEPIPVDARLTDSIVASYTDRYDEADVRRILFLPPTHPPVEALVAAADGRTWVGRETPAGVVTRRWEVFDETGTPLAAVDLPAGLTVHHATDHAVWGVVTDELDVPYVLRIPVGPQGPG